MIAGLALPTQVSCAQPFPNKPIKLITSGAPGSIPDMLGRQLAEKLSVVLHQPVIVDNRPGAGGILAMDIMSKARPDGYTLGLATMNQLVFNAYLFKKLPYDPAGDLMPVINLVSGPVVMAVNRDFPVASVEELIALAKSQPGKIHYAVPQMGYLRTCSR